MEPELDTLAQFLELGFAAAGTLAGGFFIILLIKYILESVVGQATTLHGMIHLMKLWRKESIHYINPEMFS